MQYLKKCKLVIWALQWIFKVLAGSAYIGSLTIRSLTIASLTISVLSLARQLVILKFNSFKDDDFKSKIGEIATKTSHQVSNQKIREKKNTFFHHNYMYVSAMNKLCWTKNSITIFVGTWINKVLLFAGQSENKFIQ